MADSGERAGKGHDSLSIPRGVEVLLKKASVDAKFRELLLRDWEAAASSIGLELQASERAMLSSVTADELDAFVNRVKVDAKHRRIFLGSTAAAMLAVLIGTCSFTTATRGIRPERVEEIRRKQMEQWEEEEKLELERKKKEAKDEKEKSEEENR